jgi:hypothetical protein
LPKIMDQPPATAGGSDILVELRGVEPLRPACKAGIIPLDHSPEYWSRRRESNPHPFVYETNALPHELLRKKLSLEARGGIEPRAFPPSSCRFGLEDRCRERGPRTLTIFDCQLPIGLLTNSASMPKLEMKKGARFKPIGNRKLAIGNVKWPGREADAPLRTPRSLTVTVLPG